MTQRFEITVEGIFENETITCEMLSEKEVLCIAVETVSQDVVKFRVIKYSDGWGIAPYILKESDVYFGRFNKERIPEWVWNSSKQIENLVELELKNIMNSCVHNGQLFFCCWYKIQI